MIVIVFLFAGMTQNFGSYWLGAVDIYCLISLHFLSFDFHLISFGISKVKFMLIQIHKKDVHLIHALKDIYLQ